MPEDFPTKPDSTSSFPHYPKVHLPPARSQRLFFEKSEIPRVRENARNPLLEPQFLEWEATAATRLESAWKAYRESGSIVFDLLKVWNHFTELTVVHLVKPDPKREQLLIDTIREAIALPAWDYILDGEDVIGVMRASMATSQLLFAREVLDDAIDASLDTELLNAIAEKGVLPCYRNIQAMADPGRHLNWSHEPRNEPFHKIDMSRWPLLFGSNNLRGAPTMGLGLGALALRGSDERAETWLRAAEASALTLFELFMRDGSYFEGLSYSDYTLRTILSFCDAHQRLIGSIEWKNAFNGSGYLDFVMAMQAGQNQKGNPDIVNFSDAARSIYPCIPSWIERETGDTRGQYVAEYFCSPGYFLDFLWFCPNRPAACPSPTLKNWKNSLDWVVCRQGWREQDAVLAFRSGFPVNHEHADRNSFLFKIYGERLLTDPFRAAYNRNDPNWSLRWTSAHNAVLVNGKGHQYHNGEYGVSEGKAVARIVRFEDGGQKVWWCSDATQGYQLVNPDIGRVVRTVAFAKPNLIFLFDQVTMKTGEADMEIRFIPDNRDGQAVIEPGEGVFCIKRPHAVLSAVVAGSAPILLEKRMLEPAEPLEEYVYNPNNPTANERFEDFPFLRMALPSAHTHEVVTVLVARPGQNGVVQNCVIEATDNGWYCQAEDIKCQFHTDGDYAQVLW